MHQNLYFCTSWFLLVLTFATTLLDVAFLLTAGSASKECAKTWLNKLLIKTNDRIDNEHRRIAHQLHDDINLNLLLAKIRFERLIPLIRENIPNPKQQQKGLAIFKNGMSILFKAYKDRFP